MLYTLKQILNHKLISKKVHRIIKFKQKTCLKQYIDMNPDLRKNAKNDFEKDFFKLRNNAVFGKTMKNLRKHRDIKLIESIRNCLVSEPNYYTTIFFPKICQLQKWKKTEILLNKPICLGLSILELSKILIYEFSQDYAKSKFGEKPKLCYMDTDSFMVYIKTYDIYKDIAEDVKTRLDTL